MSEITPHNPLEGERPELTLDLNDGSEEHISIVIVHKDRPEYLNICLQSIAVTSFNNNYEIIVSLFFTNFHISTFTSTIHYFIF